MILEKPIPGWSDYRATEGGEIISIKFNKRRVLRPGREHGGYLLVALCRDGQRKTMHVHRLVWQAFHGPIPPGMDIAHDDGNPGDNKLSNLKCVTRKENIADKWRHGTMACGERNGNHTQPHRRPRGERHGRAKLAANQVQEIRAEYETGNYSQRELAARYDVCQSLISSIVRGKIWSHI